MSKSEFKIIILIFLASMLLFMVLSPLMMLGTTVATIASCVLFQSFTIIILCKLSGKSKPWHLFVAIMLGSSLIELPIRICYFADTMLSFPVFIAQIISIIAGYLVYKLIRTLLK